MRGRATSPTEPSGKDEKMRLTGSTPAHLTYCLNIHPGENLQDQVEAIREHTLKVRDRIAPGKSFGLGLRLGCRAADTLLSPGVLPSLRRFLEENNLYVFTLNGFPYGTFHGTSVKTDVYRPDWRERERLDYTLRLGDGLAALLPEGQDGSISTVPGAYYDWIRTDTDRTRMVEHLAAVARHFNGLLQRTGRELHLGLEPEPDCFLERTDQVVAFINDHLVPEGSQWLMRETGCSIDDAEAMLRRHIGVCFDTCHLAVQYESLEPSLQSLVRNGIRLSKIQLSAAIRAPATAAARDQLARFVDPVYLHQIKVRMEDGTILPVSDLTAEWLKLAPLEGEWRVHFHVPLYVGQYGPLQSTGSDITPSFLRAARRAGVTHFEIETYTFGVLPESLREKTLADSITAEYQWVLERFGNAGNAGGSETLTKR